MGDFYGWIKAVLASRLSLDDVNFIMQGASERAGDQGPLFVQQIHRQLDEQLEKKSAHEMHQAILEAYDTKMSSELVQFSAKIDKIWNSLRSPEKPDISLCAEYYWKDKLAIAGMSRGEGQDMPETWAVDK
jgi:hypothetical protein